MVGGLIGHFATKANTTSGADGSTTGAPGADTGDQTNPNKRDDQKDKENREFLFSNTDPERLRETERYASLTISVL